MAFRLIVDPEKRRRRYVLPAVESVVGSAPDCASIIQHPTISRYHAAFDVGVRTLAVRDLHSKNGTWIGSRRTEGESSLVDGDMLVLGSVEVKVERVTEGDLEVVMEVPTPTELGTGDPSIHGGFRTTLPSSLLQRFSLEILPTVLERIEDGNEVPMPDPPSIDPVMQKI